jgi:predicted transcriptional regulator
VTVREKIFDYLLDQDKPQTAIEVGRGIQASNYRTVQTTISRMVKVGLLEKAERGYRIR